MNINQILNLVKSKVNSFVSWFQGLNPKGKGIFVGICLLVLFIIPNCFGKKNPVAIMETNYGTIKIELYLDKAPKTSQNFINLAEEGFYDDLIFHRVISGFMIQGGDPLGNGQGGPGYTIKGEKSALKLKHDKGVISMANRNDVDTGGSQFFITLESQKSLNGKHAIFGKVIGGMDVVKSIGNVQTDSEDKPIQDVVIQKVTIK